VERPVLKAYKLLGSLHWRYTVNLQGDITMPGHTVPERKKGRKRKKREKKLKIAAAGRNTTTTKREKKKKGASFV